MVELGEILQEINDNKGLNAENVIEKIRDELQQRDPDIYKEWKNNQFNINHMLRNGSFLRAAAKNNCEKIVGFLIERRANINLKGEKGETPLFSAAKEGHIDMVRFLIEKGADINTHCSYNGYTALHVAVDKSNSSIMKNFTKVNAAGYIEIVKLLVRGKADINAQDNYGGTPLHSAVSFGNLQVTRLLLEQEKIDVGRQTTKRGFDVLHLAVRSAYISPIKVGPGCSKAIIRYILAKNPMAHKPSYISKEPFKEMSKYWDECQNEVQEMRKQRVDGNSKVSFYDILVATPRELVHVINENILEKLETNNFGKQFPIYAKDIKSKFGSKKIGLQKILQEINGDKSINEENIIEKIKNELQKTNLKAYYEWGGDKFNISHMFAGSGYNLLLTATAYNYERVVKFLIREGVDVNAKDSKYGATSLHWAIKNGNMEILKLLIEEGNADINSADETGNSPLHRAAVKPSTEALKFLLQNGANTCVVDKDGKTPLHKVIMIIMNIPLRNLNLMEWSKVMYNSGEAGRLLIKYMLKQNPDLEMPNMFDSLPGIVHISDSWNPCQTEIKRMKEQKVDSNNEVSFYDILVAKGNKLADYMRNIDIAATLETGEYKTEFPMYAEEIENQYIKGMRRKGLLNESETCIHHFKPSGDVLPREVCYKIARHLSDVEMQQLISSVNTLIPTKQ